MIIDGDKFSFDAYQAGEYGDHAIVHGDCLEVMKRIPDKAIDLVLTDPPYGISLKTNDNERKRGKIAESRDYDPVFGDDKPFEPGPFLKRFHSVPIFLFGGNYYCHKLPQVASWYVWDKRDGVQSDDNADCELIWSNLGSPARIFRHLWKGCIRASERSCRRYHPTQKPVLLMEWLIEPHSKPGDVVLDPFPGSGTTLVAAKQLGRRGIGIEIERKYCEIAEERLRQEVLAL